MNSDYTNFILRQTHFIKTVEDIHEAQVTAVLGIKFGLAFCDGQARTRRCTQRACLKEPLIKVITSRVRSRSP